MNFEARGALPEGGRSKRKAERKVICSAIYTYSDALFDLPNFLFNARDVKRDRLSSTSLRWRGDRLRSVRSTTSQAHGLAELSQQTPNHVNSICLANSTCLYALQAQHRIPGAFER